jgi:hypothetical protein
MSKKAQEEIDAVIGLERLPELTDRDNLPYVEAVMEETLRYFDEVLFVTIIDKGSSDGIL